MKIKKVKNRIESPEPSKPGFFEWVVNSPKAYKVVFSISLIAPPVMFGIGSALLIINKGMSFFTVISVLMFLLSSWKLYINRHFFKFETNETIGSFVWGRMFGLEEFKKGLEMVEDE